MFCNFRLKIFVNLDLCIFQPQPDHGVYTVFVELGETKIEVC